MNRWISFFISISMIFPSFAFSASPRGLQKAEIGQVSRELAIHFNTAVKTKAGLLALLEPAKKQDREFLLSWLKKNRIETLPEIQLAQDGSFLIPAEKKSITLRPIDWAKGVYELNGIRFQYQLQNSLQKNFPEIEKILKQTQSASFGNWTEGLIPSAYALNPVIMLIAASVTAIVAIIGTDFLADYLVKKDLTETLNGADTLCRAKLKRLRSGKDPNLDISSIAPQDEWKIKSLESDITAAVLNYSAARFSLDGLGRVDKTSEDALKVTFQSMTQCTVELLDQYKLVVSKSGKVIKSGKQEFDGGQYLSKGDFLSPITIGSSAAR